MLTIHQKLTRAAFEAAGLWPSRSPTNRLPGALREQSQVGARSRRDLVPRTEKIRTDGSALAVCLPWTRPDAGPVSCGPSSSCVPGNAELISVGAVGVFAVVEGSAVGVAGKLGHGEDRVRSAQLKELTLIGLWRS